MKINNISGMLKAYQTTKTKKAEAGKAIENTSSVNKVDKVTLSSQGQIMQTALQAVKDSPEFRGEKVKELEQAVRTGNYQVKADAIAEKILESISFDKKA